MKDIKVSKEICKRIKTSKDLSDFYAYCERNYDSDYYDQDDYLDLSYSFDESEQDRIDELMDGINYIPGEYDEENVNRILGIK